MNGEIGGGHVVHISLLAISSRPAVGPIQPPLQRVTGGFRCKLNSRSGNRKLILSSPAVKIVWSLPPIPYSPT